MLGQGRRGVVPADLFSLTLEPGSGGFSEDLKLPPSEPPDPHGSRPALPADPQT
jgi:hypothetical protein